MSARGIPTRRPSRPAERSPLVDSVRSAKSATGGIPKPSRLQTPKPRPKNGDTVFDPESFLARAGVGKQLLNLKKNETAYAQGGAADAIFYVQKGQLRVTVTSADGKEATIALVGVGFFTDCMVSAHPLRLAKETNWNVRCSRSARRKWSAYLTKNTRCRMCSFLFSYPQRSGPGGPG